MTAIISTDDGQALDQLISQASKHLDHKAKSVSYDLSCKFCIYFASATVAISHNDREIQQAQAFLNRVSLTKTADEIRSDVAGIDYLLHGAE